MIARITASGLNGVIDAIPSKSYAHRILICAALADKPTLVKGWIDSEDFIATKECLETMGAEFCDVSGGKLIKPIGTAKGGEYNCRESGSTLRFLLPVAAALRAKGRFVGSGRLAERPIKELINVLRQAGAEIDPDKLPLKIDGKAVRGGEYHIKGSVSSQYITGLLLALPLLSEDSRLIIEGNLASKEYVDITLEVMAAFGIKPVKTADGFAIEGGVKYTSPNTISVDGDWSNAAFFLVGGVLRGDVTVGNLAKSAQGDMKIAEILRTMGGNISFGNNCVRAQKSALKGIDVDCSNIPDVIPCLSLAMANADGVSHIKGVDRLRAKESDRLSAVLNLLDNLGYKAAYAQDELTIIGGKGKAKAVRLDGQNDHRIAMTLAIAGLMEERLEIIGAECVNKSYPTFWQHYSALGGKNENF